MADFRYLSDPSEYAKALDQAKQSIATSATPKQVTSDIATNTVEKPIKAIPRQEPERKPVQMTVQQQTPQVYSPPKPQVQQQPKTMQMPTEQMQTPNIPLRDALVKQGVKAENIVWDPNTRQVTVNGIPIDTTRMNLVDGSYQATQEDINNIMNIVGQQQQMAQQEQVQALGGEVQKPTPNIPLRDTLEAQGIEVGWNEATGEVTANGVPVDTSNMLLKDGRYQASQQDIDNILNQVKQPRTIEDFEQGFMDKMEEIFQNQKKELEGYKTELSNYKSEYDKEILDTLREVYGNPFEYDPNADRGLQEAQKYAERQLIDTMNARGILNSTITRDQYGQILSSLIPQYEKIAFERYQQNINNQLKRVDVLQSLSRQDYDKFKDYIDMAVTNTENITTNAYDLMIQNKNIMYEQLYKRPMEVRQQALAERKAEVQEAYDKLKEQGYVDNDIAKVTGLDPGTFSYEASKELDGIIFGIEEQEALANNEITMQEVRRLAEQQEEEKEREKIENQNLAKSYVAQVENIINTMSARQAKEFWNENFNTMVEELGDNYIHVIADINRINESLAKRETSEKEFGLKEKEFGLKQKEFGLDVQREKRLAQTEKEEKSSIGLTTAKSEIDKFIKEKEYASKDSVRAVSEIADRIDMLPISEKQKSDLKLLYLGASGSGDERDIDDITMTQNYNRYASIYDDELSGSLKTTQQFAGATLQGTNKSDIYKEIKDNKESYIEELGEYYYNALLNRYR